MNNSNKLRSIFILLILITLSLTISYTYYFNHLAISQSSIIFNDEIYKDKTSLYFLIHNNTPSFLFVIINFFLNVGISVNLINLILTFTSTFTYVLGIYLISKFITSSIILSILISLTAVFLSKNLGDIDYPALMFHHHTAGVLSLSLSTLIFGLMTLRNLLFAFIISLFLLSIHLTVGIYMFGLLLFSLLLFSNTKDKILLLTNNKDKINFFIIGITLLFVIFFYIYWFINISADLPYEFNKKDYEEYFITIEAHLTNYGNLKNFNLDYILKTLFVVISVLLYLKFNEKSSHNSFFFKTLIISIVGSGTLYFSYKIFPKMFPEIIIQGMPNRFFLLHTVIGFPVILSVFYKFLEKLFLYKNLNKNYSILLVVVIIMFHMIQQTDSLKNRFENIKEIKKNKVDEKIFWSKVKDLEIKGYTLTSNFLCERTIIYSNLPILFCFESLDYIPTIPKLASPVKKMQNKILGISFEDLKIKNIGGVSNNEIKTIYQNKNYEEWLALKKDMDLEAIIVPKDWNLKLNLILDDKYKVYDIK